MHETISIYSYCKYNKLYIYTPNSMKFETLFLKILQFLDIQGSISDSNIYMP